MLSGYIYSAYLKTFGSDLESYLIGIS